VELQPGQCSAVSNSRGEYSIENVAPGDYTLTVSFIGFSSFTSKVTVASGQTAEVPVSLAVATTKQQVTVRAAPLVGEAEAVNIQRTADNILNVIPADVITSLPTMPPSPMPRDACPAFPSSATRARISTCAALRRSLPTPRLMVSTSRLPKAGCAR
jgi:hypothetical protein